jgi:hypothetical protein
MPVSLTLLTNGTTVSASTLVGYVNSIETYCNEQLAAADITSGSPVKSYHLFKPEFRASPDPTATFVTGFTHWRQGDSSIYGRSMHHADLVGGTADVAYMPVQDMQTRIKIPGSSARNVKILASWYTFEFGGDGTVDEATNLAARFALKTDTTIRGTTFRDLYTSSVGSASGDHGYIHARKQHNITATYSLAAGIHDVGVWVRVFEPPTPATPEWKHIFVTHRNLVVDAYTA